MTKSEACRKIGISLSASLDYAEHRYQQKCKSLQLQLLPGIPREKRHEAATELAELKTAIQTLQTVLPRKPKWPVAPTRKPGPPRVNAVNPKQCPQDLAEAWDQLFSLFPFSNTTTVIIVILLVLLFLVSMVKAILET